MSALINRYLLEQTRHDSGELVQPDFIVHPYTRAGRYQLDIFRHGKPHASLFIDVDAECGEKQLSIDLAATGKRATPSDCGCKSTSHAYRLDKEGYALFYVGSGAGGFSVKSYPVSARDTDLLFDSQHLNNGDLFGTTLLRPGRYRIEELHRKISVPLVVAPVKPGSTPYVPPDALQLDLDALKNHKDGIRLQQAQGLVFRAEHDNRIRIVLDDKESERDRRPSQVARWTRASAKRA